MKRLFRFIGWWLEHAGRPADWDHSRPDGGYEYAELRGRMD